jgi:hypothetical protein
VAQFPYDVDFEVVREGWNEYKLSDRTRLRTKLTLGKVISPPGMPPEKALEYNFNTQTMVVAYASQELKGTPSGRVLSPQDIQNAVVEDLDFEQTKVAVNEYLLENGVRIKLRLMLTRVGKTDQFTVDGSPLYAVNTQIVPEIKIPPSFRKGKTIGTTKTPVV